MQMVRLTPSSEGLAHQAKQAHALEMGAMLDELALEYAAAHVMYQFLATDPRNRMEAFEARESLGQKLAAAEQEIGLLRS